MTSLAINRDGNSSWPGRASTKKSGYVLELAGGGPRTQYLPDNPIQGPRAPFSPDGKTLASAGSDHAMRLGIRLLRQGDLRIARAHGSGSCPAFDPGGSFLVSTGDDETIRVIGLKGCQAALITRLSETEREPGVLTGWNRSGRRGRSGNVSFWTFPPGRSGHRSKGPTLRSWVSPFRPTAGRLPPRLGTRRSASGTRSPGRGVAGRRSLAARQCRGIFARRPHAGVRRITRAKSNCGKRATAMIVRPRRRGGDVPNSLRCQSPDRASETLLLRQPQKTQITVARLPETIDDGSGTIELTVTTRSKLSPARVPGA